MRADLVVPATAASPFAAGSLTLRGGALVRTATHLPPAIPPAGSRNDNRGIVTLLSRGRTVLMPVREREEVLEDAA